MALGGKARPKEQVAPRMPEASAQQAGARDEQVRAQVRAHVQQILRQVRQQTGPGTSAERD